MFGHPAQDLGSRLVGDELAASGAEAALLQEHLEFDEQSDQSFFVFFFHFQFSSFIFNFLLFFSCLFLLHLFLWITYNKNDSKLREH